jgi:tRNA(Ile)-lysidine synthase TilS/MesJ
MTFTGIMREVNDQQRGTLSMQLDGILRRVQGRGKFYDVAVGFSGGKDSVYLCHKLKQEYDIRVLAITIDHGYFPPTVEENITTVSRKLGLDVMYHRIDQAFMDRFFKHQFETYRASSEAVFDVMCAPCSE